jgi:hypothetical protein
MKLIPYDDILGDGVAHQLVTLLKIGGVAVTPRINWRSKWWQAVMLTSSGVSRIGDQNVSATNGVPIGTVNNGQFAPPIAFGTDAYPIDQIYVIINSGDVMSFARCE